MKVKRQTLGEAIAVLRNRLGISQEELAERSNVHRTYISQLERDLKSPTLETLKKIAFALGLKASNLIRLTERDSDEL